MRFRSSTPAEPVRGSTRRSHGLPQRRNPWTGIALFAALVVLVAAAGCAGGPAGAPASTPAPVKTLRPTFTHTPAVATATAFPSSLPTATRLPASPTPRPTTAPPTATPAPSPTTEAPAFTVADNGVNVRTGPGVGYSKVGEVNQGQRFEITGKNPAGDWWQFVFNGQPAWVIGNLVRANAAAGKVAVAANIPALPTARPVPTSPPAPPAPPTAPPPPPTIFGPAGAEFRNADDANFGIVTFWGRLGRTTENPVSGYRLRVSAPSGTIEAPFRDVWEIAYSGYATAEFRYNAKAELPRAAGGFRAVVIDGAGKEVSDPISGTLIDRTHDVILSWQRR